VHNRAVFPIVPADTLPLRPAAAGNERFLFCICKRADIEQFKFGPVTLAHQLRTGQAPGNPFSALYRICIKGF
jgi:hypothetical protein